MVPNTWQLSCGLYYKPMTIINDNSRVINKLEASFTDNMRVIIYDRHMFIVQATGSIVVEHSTRNSKVQDSNPGP